MSKADKVVTLRVTDTICVALRKAGVMKKEANRIKVYMEMLGMTEYTAKRLDWFVNNITGVPISSEAKAAAWLADEAFYEDDGVNDWPWAEGAGWWDGTGGGDYRSDPENSNKWVPVEKKQ